MAHHAVEVSHVWKRFLVPKDRADSVGRLLLQMLPGRRRRPPELFWALRDVDFHVEAGRSLGVIGRNGSGKSTLLKILSRTMRPTAGSVRVRGQLSSLIELGAGFHPEFTGRENVYLSASLLGIRRREVERRFEAIVAFSEIEPFIDTPVKYYSSGMQARLGFAVAIHVEPDVLLVDEVLAVGDLAFQEKCMARIRTMKRQGVSILLVSHDLESVRQLMDEVVWLEAGSVRAWGAPQEVTAAYRAAMGQGAPSLLEEARWQGGGRSLSLELGSQAELHLSLLNRGEETLSVGVSVAFRRGTWLVNRFESLADGVAFSVPPGRHDVVLLLPEVLLPRGFYDVDIELRLSEGRVERHPAAAELVVGPGGQDVEPLPHVWWGRSR